MNELENVKIGQICYIIPPQKSVVLPFRVIEIINKQTLQGVELIHKVECKMPDQSSNNTEFILEDLFKQNHQIFWSLQTCQLFLLDKANKNIENIIGRASDFAKKWYGNDSTENKSVDVAVETFADNNESVAGEYQIVTFPDGTKAKVRIVNPTQ